MFWPIIFAQKNVINEGLFMKDRFKKAVKSVGTSAAEFKTTVTNLYPLIVPGNKWRLAGGGLLTCLNAAEMIFSPLVFSKTIIALATQESTKFGNTEISPMWMAGIYGATVALGSLTNIARNYVYAPIGPKATEKLVVQYMDHLMNESLDHHLSTPLGDHINCLRKCFESIPNVTTQMFTQIFPTLLEISVAIGVLSKLFNREVAAGLVTTLVAYVSYSAASGSKITKIREEMGNLGFKVFEDIVATIQQYETIHAFNNLPAAIRKFSAALKEFTKKDIEANLIIQKIGGVQTSISALGFAIITTLVANAALNGSLTPSAYVTISSYLLQFSAPLAVFGTAINQLRAAITELGIVFKELEKPRKQLPTRVITIQKQDAEVRLANVKFHYEAKYELCLMTDEIKPEKDKLYLKKKDKDILYTVLTPSGEVIRDRKLELPAPDDFDLEHLNAMKKQILEKTKEAGHIKKETPIFRDVTLTIPAGKKTGIVARSGGGKSTLTNLLFRHYDAIEGDIRIGGEKITDYSPESVRRLISIVPQTPILFNDTLYNNIAYGGLNRPGGVTPDDVKNAVAAACLTDFVKSLGDGDFNKGLQTVVGERGAKLSGGQRQRVAIARAFLKNPLIYIFDEATSALDNEVKHDIQKNMDEISKGTTTIVITHDLPSLVNADKIIVFDKGLVAEQGTHKELLALNGVYADLSKKMQSSPNKTLEESDFAEEAKVEPSVEIVVEAVKEPEKEAKLSTSKFTTFAQLETKAPEKKKEQEEKERRAIPCVIL